MNEDLFAEKQFVEIFKKLEYSPAVDELMTEILEQALGSKYLLVNLDKLGLLLKEYQEKNKGENSDPPKES